MSNIIPPMLSSSPPPVDDQVEEDEDDEFGDFRVADHSLSFADFNQSNDSAESPDLWTKPFSPSPSLDEEGVMKSPQKLPNGIFTPLTDSKEKECDSPQHLNVFIQPVSESNSIMSEEEKLPEEVVEEENQIILDSLEINDVQSNHSDISFELSSEEVQDNALEIPQAQDSIPGLSKEPPDNLSNKIETVVESDDLGDFKGCELSSVNKTQNDNEIEDDAFSEFRTSDNNVQDEFSDFADFTSDNNLSVKDDSVVNVTEVEKPEPIESFNEDDFDDFECADFEPSKEPSVEETLEIMFPHPHQEVPEEDIEDISLLTECLHSCLDDSTSVWGHLKELETSHALSYQWSNSSANKFLLSSLNIDSRYVLYGSRWNASIPRFAANLGFSPLEPMKASETPLVPQPAQQQQPQPPTRSSSVVEEVVPAAQFDWTSSGLTNPLDCLEKEAVSTVSATTPEQTTPSFIEKDDLETIKENILTPTVVNPSSGQNIKNEESSASATCLTPTVASSSYSTVKVKRKDELSPEAYNVVESFPDLSFLSARKLMCTANENMSRWRTRP